jgi:glycerol-3-phosphate dehydrogenase
VPFLPAVTPPFTRDHRDEQLASLGDEPVDVLVIGGGITGAGIARDAAMRGLRTVLVERGDLASGTSSASSKLVHGGLRYLEQGNIGLVWESVSERHRLRQLAPHLARPIPFVFPVHHKKPRPLWQISTGLWIYDTLAMFRSYRLHRTYGKRRTAALEPDLSTDGLNGCVHYYDCITDDARLTLETARGAHEAGAAVLTYCRVTGFLVRRSQVAGVEVVDLRTGREVPIQARVVVNATGPWVDRTLGLRGDRPRMLRPTKGAHCVVARSRLPVRNVVCLRNPDDRRMLFAIPWGSRVLLGTTDTDYQGDFDEVRCEREDIDYLLAGANRWFPDAHLQDDDVLGTFAGLRPLVAPGGEGLKANQVSREHTIRVDPDGLVTVAGGKLTTYRTMAAEVVATLARRLKAEGMHIGGCPTGSVRLPGGVGVRHSGDRLITLGPDGAEAEIEVSEHLGQEVTQHLKEAHGGHWLSVAGRAAEDRDLARRIVPDLPYVWAELDHAVASEMTLTLSDFMRRRTQLEIRDLQAAWEVAPALAARMGGLLGWDAAAVEGQVVAWRRIAARSMEWREAEAAEG